MEEIINKLDQRGCMVLTILIGKRMLELLKNTLTDTKDTLDTKKAKDILSNIIIPKDYHASRI